MNGFLLSKNKELLRFEKDVVTQVFEPTLIPLYFLYHKDIISWIESRAIDGSRANSRQIKRATGVSLYNDFEAAMRVHAATITDSYWIKEDNETITWEDVRFHENRFAKLALTGKDFDLIFQEEDAKTPELTNIGNKEKCWEFEDGTWWLYKNESEDEVFNELFISELGKGLGFNMATYTYVDKTTCKTPSFVGDGENFEPMWRVAVEHIDEDGKHVSDEDYSYNVSLLREIFPEAEHEYLNMVYLDVLCMNADRHTKNYGFIRDSKNGNILSLAPNYDNNLALLYFKVDDAFDGQIKLYCELFSKTSIKYDFPKITKELIEDVMDLIYVEPSIDKGLLVKFLVNRAKVIENEVSNFKQCSIAPPLKPTTIKRQPKNVFKEETPGEPHKDNT